MLKPLALLCCENAVLGSQLLHRLDDLGYRTETKSNVLQLVREAVFAKPLVIIMDLVGPQAGLLEAIRRLRETTDTNHIPIIGIARDPSQEFQAEAVSAGVTLVAMESGILAQLDRLLDQALAVD